jgi:hypothetical protein
MCTSSNLMLIVVSYFERLVRIHQATWCQSLED